MREDEAVTGAGGTVGAQLHARRTAQNLSLDEVAERTRIPVRHLEAIEASDYAALPAAPYAVGFVKSYARLLGEPADELGRNFRVELDAVEANQPQQQAFEPADPARVPPARLAIAALIVAILFVLGFGAWRAGVFGTDNPAARARLAADTGLDQPRPAPVAAPGATPQAPAAAAGPVVITAMSPAWIRVSDGDTRLFMDTMKAGDRFEVPAGAQAPVLRTAAAQAIRVTVGSTAIPQLGPPSTLVKDVSLKPADLLARGNGGPAAPAEPAAAPPTTAPPTPASDRPEPARVRPRHRPAARADTADEGTPGAPAATAPTAPAASAPAAATAPATSDGAA